MEGMSMLVKEQLHAIADELSAEASVEEAIEKLIVLHKVEIGLQQADEGRVIPHEEVEKRVLSWGK